MRLLLLFVSCSSVVAVLSQARGAGVDTVNKYLVFREERLERRLARSRVVLSNLEGRYEYVKNALAFQNHKAKEMVERAVNDSKELVTDEAVLKAMLTNVPPLELMANTTVPTALREFSTLMGNLRNNVSTLMQAPVNQQLDAINASILNRTAEFSELETAINVVEHEVDPWARNYTEQAAELTSGHVDGLLVRMADGLAAKVKETAKILKASGEPPVLNATDATEDSEATDAPSA